MVSSQVANVALQEFKDFRGPNRRIQTGERPRTTIGLALDGNEVVALVPRGPAGESNQALN